MRKDNTEEIFRKKLADYEWSGDIPAWEEIEASLPKPAPRFSFWRVGVAACLLIGTCSWLFGLFLRTDISLSESPATFASYPNPDPTEPEIPSEPRSELFSESVVPATPVARAVPALSASSHSESGGENYFQEDVPKPIISEEIIPADDLVVPNDIKKNDVQKNDLEKVSIRKNVADNSLYAYNPGARSKKNKQRNPIALGVVASNFSVDSDKSAETMEFNLESYRPVHNPAGDSDGHIRGSLDKNQLSGFNHRLPVRVGIMGSYMLLPRLSVETGLMYSFHDSDFSRLDGSPVEGVQKLHFMGIPVNIIYNIIENQSLRLYVGAGGEMDINLRSKQRFEYSTQTLSSQYRQKEPIWGVGLKLGGAYRLFDKCELYLEPALMKYWSKGSLHTWWTDQQFAFNLNFGIRTLF